MALAYGALEALRVLVLAPFLLALPGYLLLLPLAPRWTHLARAVVGTAITSSALALGLWALNARAGVAYDGAHLWALYGALLGGAAFAAWAARAQWRPHAARPRLDARLAWLLAALAVNAFLLIQPRLGYAMPIHQDEWTALGGARAIVVQHTTAFIEPTLQLGRVSFDGEIGFHLFAANLILLTGADPLALFYYAPLMLGALIVIAAWCCGEKEGYGPEAALVVALLPSSVRLLGPQFFVPLSLGLFFIPTCFLLFTSTSARRTLPIVALMVVFVFYSHPQSDAALGILIGTFAILTVRHSLWKSLALLALAAVPFVLGELYFAKQLDTAVLADATTILSVPDFVGMFGILGCGLFLAGAYLTLLSPSRERLAWLVTSGAHLTLIVLFLVPRVGQANLYDRAWMHGMLTMSFTAAYALHRLRSRAASFVGRSWAPAAALALAAVLLVGGTASAQRARDGDYYHVVSENDAENFAWIHDHAAANRSQRALITPWQGTAFSSLTGIPVCASSLSAVGSVIRVANASGYNNIKLAQDTLNQGVKDDAFLSRFNVTIVYAPGGTVASKNFTEEKPGVWLRTGTG